LGIKLDLITVLTIVAVTGVLLTMEFTTNGENRKAYLSADQLKASAYQIAYKPYTTRK